MTYLQAIQEQRMKAKEAYNNLEWLRDIGDQTEKDLYDKIRRSLYHAQIDFELLEKYVIASKRHDNKI